MSSENPNLQQSVETLKRNVNPKIGIAVIILVILQSYLSPLILSVVKDDQNRYSNLAYLFIITSYFLIVFSIIIFKNMGLEIFHDRFSLFIIALSCILRSSIGGENEIIFEGVLFILGIALLVYMKINWKILKVPSGKSVLIGLIWSALTVVTTSFLRAWLDPSHQRFLPTDFLFYTINATIFQLSFVVVVEEACFRGLVFSFLKLNGYKEDTALFIQAILFWGIHYINITKPILFFIVIPLFTLSASLIMKKYKMLYLPILLHLLFNVFGGVLVAIF